MLTPDDRTIARLGSEVAAREVDVLKERVVLKIEAETQELARRNWKLPDLHDRVEWQCLRARHDGMLEVFNIVKNAQADVAREEGARQ